MKNMSIPIDKSIMKEVSQLKSMRKAKRLSQEIMK